MKTKKAGRTPALHSKLAAYSATATAALALSPTLADAQGMVRTITQFSYDQGVTFTNTPPDQNLGFYAETALLGGFKLGARHNSATGDAFIGPWIAVDNQLYAARLAFGDQIAGHHFTIGSGNYLLALNQLGVGHGNFQPVGPNAAFTGYAAFEAKPSAGHTYYGWLRVKVSSDANGFPFLVTLVDKNGDGVYGAFDSKNDPNFNNFTAGQIAPVPEPSITAISGLGLLALGAHGVRELRRRRKLENASAKN